MINDHLYSTNELIELAIYATYKLKNIKAYLFLNFTKFSNFSYFLNFIIQNSFNFMIILRSSSNLRSLYSCTNKKRSKY